MLQNSSSQYHIAWSGRCSEEAVTTIFDDKVNNAVYSVSDLVLIDQQWQARERTAASEGRRLYNSAIFRLASHQQRTDGNLVLHVGVTDYREYVATRSEKQDIARANPIGTCVIPVTVDGRIPIGRRSQAAEVNPGKFFTFGGFFDAALDLKGTTPNIFSCIQREVQEEIGIELASSALELVGIVNDLVNIHPEISFVANLEMSSSEVASSGWKAELDDLIFVQAKDCLEFLNKHRLDFTPTLIGALEIFAGTKYS
ncbi:hypothetical protein [Allorhizobium undicola]|uniref:hypothetical protein n=1 Tax=Allorhizobium undicola TaxID=78527 RepID=UPI0012B67C73|nr:hypothetical protein [Allorhizobium undicola]